MKNFPPIPIRDITSFEELLIIIATHYLIKARLLNMSEDDILNDLAIDIANFDAESATDIAIDMLRPHRGNKLN